MHIDSNQMLSMHKSCAVTMYHLAYICLLYKIDLSMTFNK